MEPAKLSFRSITMRRQAIYRHVRDDEFNDPFFSENVLKRIEIYKAHHFSSLISEDARKRFLALHRRRSTALSSECIPSISRRFVVVHTEATVT